jgi:hypothetical protein
MGDEYPKRDKSQRGKDVARVGVVVVDMFVIVVKEGHVVAEVEKLRAAAISDDDDKESSNNTKPNETTTFMRRDQRQETSSFLIKLQ